MRTRRRLVVKPGGDASSWLVVRGRHCPALRLRTTHAVATVVAEVAVAVADRDRPTVVATGSVGLETGKLIGTVRLAGSNRGLHGNAGPLEQSSACFACAMAVAVLTVERRGSVRRTIGC